MAANDQNQSLVGRTIFGEYTITQKLGEGGMGAVYLAQQSSIDQKIAIKVLHGQVSKQDEMVKRFNREAKVVSILTHPNIIRVFIFGRTEDGLLYLAMEFVEGGDLGDDIRSKGAMSELRAIKLLKQTLSALSEAHELGIVHRDLKPDNILLTEYRKQKDFVKVLDFGIAKIKDPTGGPVQKLTQAGVVYGTPEYLSPEQAQAIELDHRSDIYSVGCLLFEMITGKVPFTGPTAINILMSHVYEAIPNPSERKGGPPIAPQMEQIILKAMAKKPEDRYQTAMEFFEALVQREQELMAQGQSIEQVVLPGSDVTRSFVMDPKLMEAARTSVYNPGQVRAAQESNQAPARNGASPNSVTVASPVVKDPRRTLLVVLILLLLLLLVVIVVGIAILKSK